jgi:hypothetical protein
VNDLPRRLLSTAQDIADAAAEMGWRGPDAYDGLWYDWPAPLVGGRRRRQVLMQLHARSPLDIRRLYRRRHPLIPKALGIFGSVGLRAAHLSGDDAQRDTAMTALQLLDDDRSAGDAGWGYHWDMQTRWSYYPAGSPNVVVTAFGAAALLESDDPAFEERARSAARWVLDELWVQPEGYFAYHPGRPVNIHNASLLGAWLVHVGLPEGDHARACVRRAVERTLADQRPDGSWPYGEGGSLGWVDSFHTGYVLTCLQRLAAVAPEVEEAVARGARYYEGFFDEAGRAQLWLHKRFPEDAHAAGTGLTTLATLARAGHVDRALLTRVAERVLACGVRGRHAVYRRYRWGATTVKYLRWADAHVALGLVDAAALLSGADDLAPRPQAPAA